MIAVITGDIVQSRRNKRLDWVEDLKAILVKYALKNRWEIFRGDSFQLEVSPEKALNIFFLIKLDMILLRMDARMSIGVGDQNYKGKKVTESNGSAYIRSGEGFENLQKRKLSIRTDDERKDAFWNVAIDLAMLAVDRWTVSTAELILLGLSNPQLNQKEMAELTHRKSQSTVSAALKRSGYHEIKELIDLFSQTITQA